MLYAACFKLSPGIADESLPRTRVTHYLRPHALESTYIHGSRLCVTRYGILCFDVPVNVYSVGPIVRNLESDVRLISLYDCPIILAEREGGVFFINSYR